MYACIYIPNASGDTAATILDCAAAFSPRVERTSSGAVVFDVEGLERLFGSYSEIAEKVAEAVRARGFSANIAVASNADAAICAARGFSGTTVLNRGTEAARLRDLPLAVLELSPDTLETLQRWGIRTLGAFAKLPAIQVSERLGQEGVKLHKLAQGSGTRTLVPHVDALRFVEVTELDYDITTIEPLTFILSRMLDAICARMRSRNLATHEVRLALGTYVRVLNLPLPVRNSRLLTKLLILDLEAHPPGAVIKRVEVEAIPAKPRVVQNGLFVPLSPEPEKLELTLARLKAVVGEENVGAPQILDTHRPDALQVKKFGAAQDHPLPLGEGRVRVSGLDQLATLTRRGSPLAVAPPSPRGRGPHITLRLLRPALEATMQLRNGIPTWIAFHGVHGSIATASGPWHTSGDWWRPNMWDREEWDIEVADALYRIYYDVHMDRWYAQGVYD
jgi:protein ImuB